MHDGTAAAPMTGRPPVVSPDDWQQARVCAGCSAVADSVGHLAHLHARDTSFVLTSIAPWAELAAFQARMGWTVPWYSCAPHCVPMWVGVESEGLAFLSSLTSVKGRNLRRDPRGCE